MPLLDQPDTSIYRTTKLFSSLTGPGQLSQGGGSGPSGPTAAQQRFGAEQQENAQIAALAQQYGDDYDGLIGAVERINPARAFEMGSKLEAYRKDQAAKDAQNTRTSIDNIDLGSRLVQTAIEDPSKWPTVRNWISSASKGKLDPILPSADVSDPEALKQQLTGLVTAIQPTKDYLAAREKAAQLYFDGKKVEGALTLLSASSPATWQNDTALVKNGGLGGLLPDIPDPATAKKMLEQRQADNPTSDKGLQHVSFALPKLGNVQGTFDPNTGKYFYQGKDVTDQAKQSTPASVIIKNMGGGIGGGGDDLVAGSVRTTLSGKKYLDMSDFDTPSQKAAARVRAQKLGVIAVDAKTGASLRAIDSAKQNAMAQWRQIAQFLPKDAAGRVLGGPKNTLAQIFQTHPELGAYGSWRTAAIQQVQALAEPGMGLRINQAEINAAMENDIPQITDDGPTAAMRLKNLFTMLNNKENDALTRDRSTLNPDAPAAVNPFAPPKK